MALIRFALMIVLPFLLSGPKVREDTIAYIDKQVHRSMRKLHLPAFAITIVEDQDILCQKATGLIDLEKNLSASTNSVFKLWSLSKVFTAIEIFRESEEGLVDLNAPLKDYLPHFNIQNEYGDIEEITIKSLLAHRSGLPRNECLRIPAGENDCGTLDRFEIATWDCLMAFPTGYRYKYSNLGYDLLGRVIEENRNQGYAQYMTSLLSDSLGMEKSTFDSQEITDSDLLVKGYEYHKGKFLPRVQMDINSVPSGNLSASTEDISKFLQMVFQGELFEDIATMDLMFEDHYSRPEDPETMGLGWKTTRLNNSELLVWHDGGPSEGIGSVIALLPDRKLGIAMMGNSTEFSGATAIQLAIKILNHILADRYEKIEKSTDTPERILVSRKDMERYEGRYLAWGTKMDVKGKNKKMRGRIGGFGLNLIPLSETNFRVTHWMDQIGLTKIFKPPMAFEKIKISFVADSIEETTNMIINLDHLNYEICPPYPDQLHLPSPMENLPGNYMLAWRLPYNEAGPFSGDLFSISMEKEILSMSGVFGPLLPRNNNQLSILCGPFAGEIMEIDAETGNIFHQNAVFIPNL